MTGIAHENVLLFGVDASGEPVALQLNPDGTLSGVGGGGGPSPYTSTPEDISIASGNAGNVSLYSRGNHRHKIVESLLSLANFGEKAYASLTGKPTPNTVPNAVVPGDPAVTGMGPEFAYDDHIHDFDTASLGLAAVATSGDFDDLINPPVEISLSTAFASGLLAARPAAGNPGYHYFATDTNGGQLSRDNGVSWDVVAAPNNPVITNIRSTNTWKVIYINGSGVPTELSLGAAATYFRSGGVSAAPTWVSVVLTEIAGGNWKLPYTGSAGAVNELSLGAVGTYLRGGGVAAAPTFSVIAPSELTGGNWKVLYTNGSGVVTELALGAAGTYIRGNGVAAAPTFAVPAPTELVGGLDKVLYNNHATGAVTELALGATAGQAFITNGAAAAPSFAVVQSLLLENAPTQITANQNDYTFGGSAARVQRINSNAAVNLTGFSVGQTDGYMLQLVNTGTFVFTLKNQVTSTAVNQILTPNSQDFLLFPGDGVLLRYSGTATRWLLVGGYGMPMPFLQLNMSGTQNISTATTTAITFDTIAAQSSNWLPAASGSQTEISMPFTGWVILSLYDLDWGDSSTGLGLGDRRLGSRRNNTAGNIRMGCIHNASGDSATSQQLYREVYVVAGDTFAFVCRHTSGSTQAAAAVSATVRYSSLGTYTLSGTNP